MTFTTLLSFDVDHDRIDELFTALDLGFTLDGIEPIADFPEGGPPLPPVEGGRRTYEFGRTRGDHRFSASASLLRYPDEYDVLVQFDRGMMWTSTWGWLSPARRRALRDAYRDQLATIDERLRSRPEVSSIRWYFQDEFDAHHGERFHERFVPARGGTRDW